jgi:hypothetical protein
MTHKTMMESNRHDSIIIMLIKTQITSFRIDISQLFKLFLKTSLA